MKTKSIFITALVMGTAACYFVMREKPSPKMTKTPVNISTPASNPQISRQFKISDEAKIKLNNIKSAQPPVALPPNNVVATAGDETTYSAPMKHHLEISLSEEDIANLEQHWDELPRQAEAMREDRGWRITTLQPDSLLYVVGLQEGDLVTADLLTEVARGDEELANRIANILDHITVR